MVFADGNLKSTGASNNYVWATNKEYGYYYQWKKDYNGNNIDPCARLNEQAIMIILPVILVIISEHIGHQVVTSKIVGRDLLKDPGLHRSLFADNFSTMLSGMIGNDDQDNRKDDHDRLSIKFR